MGCMQPQNQSPQKYQIQHTPQINKQKEIQQLIKSGNWYVKLKGSPYIPPKIQSKIQYPISINNHPQLKEQIQNFQFVKFNTLYQECIDAYSEHLIDKAGQIAKKIISTYSHQYQSLGLAKQYQKCQTIQIEYDNVIKIHHQIYSKPWNIKYQNEGLKISSFIEDSTVAVLIQSIIEVPFQVFISVFTEIDLFKEYIPFMVESKTEKLVSRNCKLGFSATKFPFLAVRQSFFQGIGYNRLQFNGTIFLYTTSIENNQYLQKIHGYEPKLNPDAVQLIYKYVALKYQPICKGRGNVTLAINGDMKISLVPLFLMQYLSIDFGKKIFKRVVDISQKFKGSQWQDKVNQDPRLFNFYKYQIDSYLRKMQKI